MSSVQKYDSYTCTVKEFKDLNPKSVKIIDFIDRRNVYAAVKDADSNICLVRYELRTALLCPEKTRKKESFYLPQ